MNQKKNIKKKNIKFDNKYRASRDGNKYDDLYTIIGANNYKNFLLLIQTTTGLKFGIFLSKKTANSQNNYGYYNNNKPLEPKTFIFSVNNNKIMI